MDAGSPDHDSDRPALRASDAEREVTARILEQAFSRGQLTLAEFDERTTQAYAARFRNELIRLTTDLVPTEPATPGSFAQPGTVAVVESGLLSSPERRVTGGVGPSMTLTVMGGVERRGVWTVPGQHTAFALMGGIELDLREAALQSERTTITAVAIMGGVDILVPDDVHLEVDGIGLMGGFGEELGRWRPDPRPVRQAPPGAPTVRIVGLALMGGVGVRRVPRIQADPHRW